MNEITAQGGGQNALTPIAELSKLAELRPRNLEKFKTRVHEAITDPDVALTCWYSLPKGGSVIEGPGIRAAEIIYSNYGNIMLNEQPPEIHDDHVVATCQIIDLETISGDVKSVRRSIVGSKGNRYPQHLIETTAKAAAAIARRDAIYAVIPTSYVTSLVDNAKKRVNEAIQKEPGKIKKYIAGKLQEHGIDPKRLTEIYSDGDGKLDNMNASQLKDMLGLLNALDAGYTVEKFIGKGDRRKNLKGSGEAFSLKDLTGLGA